MNIEFDVPSDMNEDMQTGSYFKLKFEGVLSDYKREIVVKLFFYLHSFKVSCDSFIKEWQSFLCRFRITVI